MDKRILAKFVKLDNEKRELKLKLDGVTKKLEETQQKLLQRFEVEGIQSIKVGKTTVYLHRQLWATVKGGDRERACEALAAAGLGEYVSANFNTNQVSAYFRELEESNERIPEGLEAAFNVAETFKVRSRKS